jgi:predicted nuclease of predicted toxin-antitoxin system
LEPEPLRLYLDQMFHLDLAEALRSDGHDVIRASETGDARSDDAQILQKAIDDNRVLITLDEHFGDWTVLPLSNHPGVVRIKIHPKTSAKIINLLVPFLRSHSGHLFKNHLVILPEKRAKWVSTA